MVAFESGGMERAPGSSMERANTVPFNRGGQQQLSPTHTRSRERTNGRSLLRGTTVSLKLKRSGTMRLRRGESENVHKIEANVADVAYTAKAVADSTGGNVPRRLKAGTHIPWFIIDPTGAQIREQRSDASTHLQLQRPIPSPWCGLTEQQVARALVRWPTLYPYWDAVTAIALIFTALVTPLEVGFFPPAVDPRNGLWLVNRLIDLVFFFDMLFQFFTMRKMAVEKAVDANEEWEVDLRVLSRGYLCSWWFFLDVLSLAPSTFEIVPVFMGTGDSEGSGLRALRTMRSLRLIKLVRLAKSSRVIARGMEFVSLSSTSQTAIGLMVQSLLLTHWMGCIVMISTTFTASPRGTWLFTHGYCTPEGSGEVGDGDRGEDDEGGWTCVNMGFLYLKVWRWAMGLIFHNTIPMFPEPGPFQPTYLPSNIYQAKFTELEDILLILLKLIGIGFWSFTISKLIHAITVLGNPATIAYQQDIDAVNRFCTFNRLPSHLARELRRYMHNTREVHAQRSRAAIYNKLSPLLVAKVTKLLNRPLFESVLVKRALAGIPAADGERFVSAIVTSSTTAVFSPGDRPPAGRLYVITEGVAIHKLFQLLSVGDCWGDEDVLLDGEARKARETKSMTYLRVLWVERGAFRRLEDDYPEPFAKMRSYAIWKRARRILRQVLSKHKAHVTLEAKKAANSGRLPGPVPAPAPVAALAAAKSVTFIGAGTGATANAQAPSGPNASLDLQPPPAYRAINEEVMQAVDMVGGLMVETRRAMTERHEALSADVASASDVARESHAAVVALSKQMEQMQQMLSALVSHQGSSGLHGRSRSPTSSDFAAPRVQWVSDPASPVPSPVSEQVIDVLRQQVAQSRAAFHGSIERGRTKRSGGYSTAQVIC